MTKFENAKIPVEIIEAELRDMLQHPDLNKVTAEAEGNAVEVLRCKAVHEVLAMVEDMDNRKNAAVTAFTIGFGLAMRISGMRQDCKTQ